MKKLMILAIMILSISAFPDQAVKQQGPTRVNGDLTATASITTPVIKPSADSTTAIKVTNAAGTIDYIVIDSVNGRVGINKTPTVPLDVNGDFSSSGVIRGGFAVMTSIGFYSSYSPLKMGSTSSEMYLMTNNIDRLHISGQNIGIGITTPTARLHLAAGTASAGTAPMKFSEGTNLAVAEKGAWGFDSGALYFSTADTVWKTIAFIDSDITGNAATATIAADVDIASLTTEASPANGMKLIIDNDGTREKIDWSQLPGSAGGEVNTASNVGSAGVGIFKQKSGVDLQLYKVLGSGGISWTLNGTDYIDVTLDILSLTESTTPASGDYFVMYDSTAGAYKKVDSDNMPGSGGGTQIIASISGESFIYPKTGITNPFSNAANSSNITIDVDNYADMAALLSTSSNEPMQLSKFKIPTGCTSLKFRFVYAPETGNSWAGETVVWKGEWKNMTDNTAWSSVTAFSIGTDTTPGSGNAPQLYEATISLATLGLTVGDIVQMTIFVDSTSTWTHDVAFQFCEIEVVQ